MFFSSLRGSLAALVVSAVAVSAAPGLTLKTSTSNVNVDGLENLKVTTTVTNTGDETLKLLNDPRGVLSAFPENTFTVTDADGSRPSFNGAKVNRPPGYLTNTCAHAFGSAPRPSSAPRTLLALMILAFPPFSLLALQSMSPMIVSGITSIAFDLDIILRNNNCQSPSRTTSPDLALETTPSSRRTSSPTLMPMVPPRISTPLLEM